MRPSSHNSTRARTGRASTDGVSVNSGTEVRMKPAIAASPTPTSTFVIGTMIPINYEDETVETQTSGVPWGLIGGAVVVIGGAGGAYAYALNQNKKPQNLP